MVTHFTWTHQKSHYTFRTYLTERRLLRNGTCVITCYVGNNEKVRWTEPAVHASVSIRLYHDSKLSYGKKLFRKNTVWKATLNASGEVEVDVVVKFVKNYCSEVHNMRCWQQMAPIIHHMQWETCWWVDCYGKGETLHHREVSVLYCREKFHGLQANFSFVKFSVFSGCFAREHDLLGVAWLINYQSASCMLFLVALYGCLVCS